MFSARNPGFEAFSDPNRGVALGLLIGFESLARNVSPSGIHFLSLGWAGPPQTAQSLEEKLSSSIRCKRERPQTPPERIQGVKEYCVKYQRLRTGGSIWWLGGSRWLNPVRWLLQSTVFLQVRWSQLIAHSVGSVRWPGSSFTKPTKFTDHLPHAWPSHAERTQPAAAPRPTKLRQVRVTRHLISPCEAAKPLKLKVVRLLVAGAQSTDSMAHTQLVARWLTRSVAQSCCSVARSVSQSAGSVAHVRQLDPLAQLLEFAGSHALGG